MHENLSFNSTPQKQLAIDHVPVTALRGAGAGRWLGYLAASLAIGSMRDPVSKECGRQ